MYFLSHLIVLVVSIVCKYSQVKFPRCICFLVTTLSLLSSLMLILFLHRNTYQYRFWNHQMQQRQQEEKALTISSVSFLRFHSVSIMMSFSFQLWCTRASSATCRQSFKDRTQELLGKLLLKVISKWISVFNYGILLQEFIFISDSSTHRSFSPRTTKLFSHLPSILKWDYCRYHSAMQRVREFNKFYQVSKTKKDTVTVTKE